MAHVIVPPGWRISERHVTDAGVYWDRRRFVRALGLGAAGVGATGVAGSLAGCESTVAPVDNAGLDTTCDANPPSDPLQTICPSPTAELYPAARNNQYRLIDDLTDRLTAATHNNYYEFIGRPGNINWIWDLMGPFRDRPWTVELAGEIENPGVFDVADLEREFGLEERISRLRCVERWSIVVPWTGYPLSQLVAKARPLSSANWVRFTSFNRPDQAIGQAAQGFYPWPYTEALRLDEAMHPLAFVATGVYGEPLPKQHGSPLRLALPWKYGFKSIKAFQRIEFLRDRPTTFWTDFAPEEYGFFSNVNPAVEHPRWSQVEEFRLGSVEPRPTELFNGYGAWVADLYDPELLTYRS